MIEELINKKIKRHELSLDSYYDIVDYILKNGASQDALRLFIALDTFGMTKREALYLATAIRDSGRVIIFNQQILEKHSTGGVGDSTSLVIIPILATLGYKVIKTTSRSLVFTNGTSDKFKSIPNFKVKLSDSEIKNVLDKTNACVLSHKGDVCPADTVLFDIMERTGSYKNIYFLAASIASKKMASGAKVVLVDVKYGPSALVKHYKDAMKLAKVLKYIFKMSNIQSTIVITNTAQTIGEGVGNALEVVDALNVLQGKKCLLRDVSVMYATELVMKADPKLDKEDVVAKIEGVLDNQDAYRKFLDIVKYQGGDVELVRDAKIFNPYNSMNFFAAKDGYVQTIDSLLLGEMIRRLCKDTHDNNIGAVLRVKVGDFVRKGEIVLSFYYKDEEDLNTYRKPISGCIILQDEPVKRPNIIKKVIR